MSGSSAWPSNFDCFHGKLCYKSEAPGPHDVAIRLLPIYEMKLRGNNSTTVIVFNWLNLRFNLVFILMWPPMCYLKVKKEQGLLGTWLYSIILCLFTKHDSLQHKVYWLLASIIELYEHCTQAGDQTFMGKSPWWKRFHFSVPVTLRVWWGIECANGCNGNLKLPKESGSTENTQTHNEVEGKITKTS